MTETKEKKKYETPKISRVVLTHDQAIISGCSAATTRLNASTNTGCRPTQCRRGGSNNRDNANGS